MELIAEHWVVSIFITIILGAIGSGLWETVLKPISIKLIKVLFSIITFGAKRASNRVYSEAAKGHHDLPSLYLLLILTAGMVGVLISMQAILYITITIEPQEIFSIKDCASKASDVEILACKREAAKEIVFSQMPYLILTTIFVSVFVFYRFTSISLINSAVTYFEQCYRICAPHLSSDDRLLIMQRFSLMEDKEAYKKIINDLEKVANKNDIKLPELDI